jgi:hypothetical protein|tara:strand:+ start:147 stop:707 length:561 start_codon:yes stop_codon:yes gene_type:complete
MSQTPSIIVVDNFYRNPMEVREFALKQNFSTTGNFPGYRTDQPYATDELRDLMQSYLKPFGMEIDTWNNKPGDYHNGMFQYTTAEDRSWVHIDSINTNMAGVIYMTPDAPVSAGTGFYKPKNPMDLSVPNGNDITKWNLVDRVGNVFNRLILYNSLLSHSSMDYFGDCKENGRLSQVFFFSIKKGT